MQWQTLASPDRTSKDLSYQERMVDLTKLKSKKRHFTLLNYQVNLHSHQTNLLSLVLAGPAAPDATNNPFSAMSPNILTDYHNIEAFSLVKTPDRQVRFDLWTCGLEDVFLMHKRPLFCAHFVGKLVNFFHCQPPAAFTHRHTSLCCHIHLAAGTVRDTVWSWCLLLSCFIECCAQRDKLHFSRCEAAECCVWCLRPLSGKHTAYWSLASDRLAAQRINSCHRHVMWISGEWGNIGSLW